MMHGSQISSSPVHRVYRTATLCDVQAEVPLTNAGIKVSELYNYPNYFCDFAVRFGYTGVEVVAA